MSPHSGAKTAELRLARIVSVCLCVLVSYAVVVCLNVHLSLSPRGSSG